MHSTKTISIQATSLISDFISSLSQEGDLHTKTLKEYTSDLKDFVFWFENVWGKHAADRADPSTLGPIGPLEILLKKSLLTYKAKNLVKNG